MVRRLLALVPELPRLRLSSLDPAAIDEDLWRLIAEEPRLMPHLHLSLQAGSDLILKRMKRRHLRADAAAAIARARGAAAGHRDRRRSDRRLPHRNRRPVRRNAGFRRTAKTCPSCTCSPTASAPARPPRACRRCRSRCGASARPGCARPAARPRNASSARQLGPDDVGAGGNRGFRPFANISPRCGSRRRPNRGGCWRHACIGWPTTTLLAEAA